MNNLLIHISGGMPDKKVEELKLLVHKNLEIDCEIKKGLFTNKKGYIYTTTGIGETIVVIILNLVIKDLYNYLKSKLGKKFYSKFARFLKDILILNKKTNVYIKDEQIQSIYMIPISIEENELEEALKKIPASEKGGHFFYDIKEKKWKHYIIQTGGNPF